MEQVSGATASAATANKPAGFAALGQQDFFKLLTV